MVQWMFDRHGRASVITDGAILRDTRGRVIAWLHGGSVYSLGGKHIGWHEGGVVSDGHNRALVFARDHTAGLLSSPGLAGDQTSSSSSGIKSAASSCCAMA
jgi:hypothetical protein